MTARPMWKTHILAALAVLLVGCSRKAQAPAVDPVVQAMQKATANSAARVQVVRRTDWDVDPDRNQFWANVTLRNVGGDGQVALRVAIQTVVPYVGTSQRATGPEYFQMIAGQVVSRRLVGNLAAKMADKAIGVNVEVYPKAPEQPQSAPNPSGLPGLGR